MEFNLSVKKKAIAKTMKLHLKVCDEFNCAIEDDKGNTVKEYDGYVPDFMPGDHYGDYLILDIDLDSGKITNWDQVNKTAMKEFLEESNEDDD